jgi:hypothetical protein
MIVRWGKFVQRGLTMRVGICITICDVEQERINYHMCYGACRDLYERFLPVWTKISRAIHTYEVY